MQGLNPSGCGFSGHPANAGSVTVPSRLSSILLCHREAAKSRGMGWGVMSCESPQV